MAGERKKKKKRKRGKMRESTRGKGWGAEGSRISLNEKEKGGRRKEEARSGNEPKTSLSGKSGG